MPKICSECAYGSYCGPNSVACHRYPPTIMKAEGIEVTTYFPVLHPDSWCGEWKQKIVIRTPKSKIRP